MPETVEVPVNLIRKMAEASEALHELEEELEDFLISQDNDLLLRLRSARENHLSGSLRPFSEIKR